MNYPHPNFTIGDIVTYTHTDGDGNERRRMGTITAARTCYLNIAPVTWEYSIDGANKYHDEESLRLLIAVHPNLARRITQ